MSDNPADSLRRELEAALKSGECCGLYLGSERARVINALAPTIVAWLEAARADEREKTLQDVLAVVKSGLGFDASMFGTNYEGGVKRSVGVIEAMLSGTPLSYWLGPDY